MGYTYLRNKTNLKVSAEHVVSASTVEFGAHLCEFYTLNWQEKKFFPRRTGVSTVNRTPRHEPLSLSEGTPGGENKSVMAEP